MITLYIFPYVTETSTADSQRDEVAKTRPCFSNVNLPYLPAQRVIHYNKDCSKSDKKSTNLNISNLF